MTDRIRFHLDESVDPELAAALRRYGIDATTSVEADLRGVADTAQLAYALRESRVLITHDADFLRLTKSLVAHAGIAYCSRRHRSIGEMIRSLVLIYELLTPNDMANSIEFL